MNLETRSKLKLMIVDDELDNLDLLFRTFRQEFQVYKAESAFEALNILEEFGEMAVIISDQRMPEMYGTEFLSQTVEQFPDTIRILLTGYTDVEDLVDAINSGQVFKYITKPWSPDSLKSVIQQACETYQFSKQRTNALRLALRRESLYNEVVRALRESLDYSSMLHTIAQTLGETFMADGCCICGVDSQGRSPEMFTYSGSSSEQSDWLENCNALIDSVAQAQPRQITQSSTAEGLSQITVPLTYQQQLLAILVLYRAKTNEPWTAEDIQLLEAVSEQAALALSQAKLHRRTVELAEQMQSELEVARQIQTNLLRQSWPESERVKIQACCHPAREVGGDFFEVYIHSQGDIWVALGDVSGKGVPAALFMASAMSAIRRELSQETSPDPKQVMHNLNYLLSDDLISNNYFITMVLARYTPSTGELAYTNAGHIYPMVWSQTRIQNCGKFALEPDTEPHYLKARGIPLGILPVWRGQGDSIQLASGDVFLLTSDGITEIVVDSGNSNHHSDPSTSLNLLHQQGLWELLRRQPGTLDLDQLLALIRASHPVQDDDQTMLSLEVLPTDEN
ncbi:MAG: SpoIIE family protein phosphatase [Oscillatoriales cyanobacterium SM2_3_0]|nr:SpoIIE family protein phosphatase [Oscillatoriales cyanobacterium SM2_3_0]